jgi:D-alanine transaminase
MPTPLPTSYLDGRYLPLAEARISPLDRGFLFGDAVYEVIPVYNGRPFRLDAHLERLTASLAAIRLADPLTPARWREVLAELIARNGGGRQAVYLQVTRGAEDGRAHRLPARVEPTVFAMSQAFAPAPQATLDSGIAAVTAQDIRWRRCDIKSTSLLANVLLRQRAEDANAAETLLTNDGLVTEGASSTVFIVAADGALCTPPKDTRLLPGTTRDLIVELARGAGFAFEARDIPVEELGACREVWISSALREVLPVTRIDETSVGDGRPGPAWRRINDLFQRYNEESIAS